MNQSVKDLFSTHSDIYAKYRPLYPKELYEFILAHVKEKNKALDCGTGNGQAAGVLADYFKEVHATDISAEQIRNAVQKPNLHYHITNAEKLPFTDSQFDLITVATALHWFNLPIFYQEVQRVAKNDAVFAAWAYSLFRTSHHGINGLIDHFYYEEIHSWWDPERKHVDEEYQGIDFPFAEITNPGFFTLLTWNLETLEGYLNTWSAVQHFIRQNNHNPVSELMETLKKNYPEVKVIEITFPIFMRAGNIKK